MINYLLDMVLRTSLSSSRRRVLPPSTAARETNLELHLSVHFNYTIPGKIMTMIVTTMILELKEPCSKHEPPDKQTPGEGFVQVFGVV